MLISSNFVQNGYDDFYPNPCVQFEQALVEATIAYENEKRLIKERVESAKLQSFIMETDETDSVNIYTEAEKNIFARLGEMVVNLLRRFTAMCDKIIEKLKGGNLKGKSGEQKLDKLAKKHPELTKEKIRDLAEEGGLNFADFESLSKLDSEFYRIMKMAEDSKVDPKSFRGKCQEFEKKVKNDDTKLQTAAKVAGAAGAVIGLAAAVKKYKKDSAELGVRVAEAKETERKLNKALYDNLKAAYRDDGKLGDAANKKVDEMGKFELLVRMNNLRMNKKNKAISNNTGALNNFYMAIVKGIDKVVGSGAGKAVFGDVAGNTKDDINRSSFADKSGALHNKSS